MGITIKEDLSKQPKYHWDCHQAQTGSTGSEAFVREFYVSGLEPTADMCYKAATATDSTTGFMMPEMWDEHPSIPGIFAQNCDSVPYPADSKTSAKVSYQYKSLDDSPPGGINFNIQIGNAASQRVFDRETANTVANSPVINGVAGTIGRPLAVNYVPPGGTSQNSNVKIPFESNDSTLRWTMPVRFAPGNSPLLIRQAFCKMRNSTTWMGFPPSTVVCTSIEADLIGYLRNGVRIYRMTYVFEQDQDWLGFARVAYFADALTGVVPLDIHPDLTPGPDGNPLQTSGNGWRLIWTTGTADFNLLNLRAP